MAVDFSATPLVGYTPQDVVFEDLTVTSPPATAWHWQFGDGGSSDIQNPTHTFITPGNFDISLTVAAAGFSGFSDVARVPVGSNVSGIGVGAVPFTPEGGYRVHVGQWDNNYGSVLVFVYTVAADGSVERTSTYNASTNQPAPRSSQVDIDGYMGFVGSEATPAYCWHEGPTGIQTVFIFIPDSGDWFGHTDCRFCKLGDDFFFAGNDPSFGSTKVYKFSRPDTSAPVVVSDPLYTHSTNIVTDGTNVYAIGIDGVSVSVLDADTLALIRTISTPLNPPDTNTHPILTIDRANNDIYLLGMPTGLNNHTWKLNSDDSWTIVYDSAFAGNDPGMNGAYEGHIYNMSFEGSDSHFDWLISELAHVNTLTRTAYINLDSGLGVRLPELLMPSSLPSFLANGHTVQFIDIYGNVSWSTGEDSKRMLYTSAPRIVSVSMDLSAAQMADFYYWFEGPISVGTQWFSCQLANFGPGLLWFKSRFHTPYIATPDDNGLRWEVKFNLYVLGEGQFTPPERTSFNSARTLLLEAVANPAIDQVFSSSRVLALATMNYAFGSARQITLDGIVTNLRSYILLEGGGFLLQENSSKLILTP